MISVLEGFLAQDYAANNCTISLPTEDKNHAYLFTTVRSNHMLLLHVDAPGPVVLDEITPLTC